MPAASMSAEQKRLAELEKRMRALENALMAEKRKTAALEQLVESRQNGLDQVLSSYERAFEQAAKSYEPIIQRALRMSGSAGRESAPGNPPLEPPPANEDNKSALDNLASIFKDVPKTLAGLALIISLFTGGTSVVSLFQSNLAQSQVEQVSDQVQQVEEEAQLAQQEASEARLEATEAKAEAESAKENASEAKQEAEVAQDEAAEAKLEAMTAKQDAASVKTEIERVKENEPPQR